MDTYRPAPGTEIEEKHYSHRRDREARVHLIIKALTAFFSLATFVIFLLVGLGLPVIKNIWLLTLNAKPYDNSIATSVATELRFGTWGWCAVGALGKPLCVGPGLGYSLTSPVDIAAFVGQPNLTNGVSTGLTLILVLHPICAALAFLLLILCLFLHNHAAAIVALVVAVVLGLISGVSVAVDLALVIVAHDKVPAATNGDFSVSFANGVWLALAGFACAWICIVVISIRACLCCGLRRKF